MSRKIQDWFTPLLITIAVTGFYGCSSTPKEKPADAAVASQDDDEIRKREKELGKGVLDSDSGAAMGLRSLHFEYRDVEPIDSDRETLEANARILNSQPSLLIQIEGHCDQRGTDQINFPLAEKRAEWVKKFFVSKGVSSRRLMTISYGKTRLLDKSETPEGMFKNRRVNFLLVSR